jgi:hypothetical protein
MLDHVARVHPVNAILCKGQGPVQIAQYIDVRERKQVDAYGLLPLGLATAY